MNRLTFSGALAVLALSVAMQPTLASAEGVTALAGTQSQYFTGTFVGLKNNMLTLGMGTGTRVIFVPSSLAVSQTFGDPLALTSLTVGSPLRISCIWDPANKYYVATSISLVDATYGTDLNYGGYGYGSPAYGGAYGWGGSSWNPYTYGGGSYGWNPSYGGSYGGYGYNPCGSYCVKPAYPYSNTNLFSDSLNAYNTVYDFDTAFAKKADQSQFDAVKAFDADTRSIAADTIKRVSDSYVDVNRESFARFDQWKNVEIIRVNEGTSKAYATKESFTRRDLDVIDDAHFRDNASSVSSLDKAHTAQASQAAHGATSLNQAANAWDADTLKKNLNTGYLY